MNRILLDLPEVVETPRLILQMPKAGFGKSLHEAIIDGFDDYVEWLNWPNILPSEENIEEQCRLHHADFILRKFIRYIIIEKSTNTVVGRCAFPDVQSNWSIPQFGISYFIRKIKRSNGYATEAVNALSILAFKILRAKKLEIYCDIDNKPSIAIPHKLGFKFEYEQNGGWNKRDGSLALLQTYSIFSENDLKELKVMW